MDVQSFPKQVASLVIPVFPTYQAPGNRLHLVWLISLSIWPGLIRVKQTVMDGSESLVDACGQVRAVGKGTLRQVRSMSCSCGLQSGRNLSAKSA